MDNLVIKNLVQIREQCKVQYNSFGTEGRGTGFVVSTYMTGNRSRPAAKSLYKPIFLNDDIISTN
jgi:hypothetical protein